MSGIDLTNPQVLANFIKSQIKERKGKYFKKDNAVIFRDEMGNEFLVPDDVKVPKEEINKEEKDSGKDDKPKKSVVVKKAEPKKDEPKNAEPKKTEEKKESGTKKSESNKK